MTTPKIELAVAALTVTHLGDKTSVYRFVEAVDQNIDPYHQAIHRLRTVLREDPQASHALVINERALDLAVVTMMRSVGYTDYTLADAEETRRIIAEIELLDDPNDVPAYVTGYLEGYEDSQAAVQASEVFRQ